MATIYSGSIDVTKIDKSKLIDGKKGTYLDISIVIDDEENQFGQIGNIQQGQTKEEREAKAARIYLGNLKQVWSSEGGAKKAAPAAATSEAEGDLPF